MFLKEIQKKVVLLTILVVASMQSTVFAIDRTPLTEGVTYKTLEEVQTGIANQLEYLISYNETSISGKKWYVYVVGDDTFNPEMMSGEGDAFLENQFDLTDIGIEYTPVDNIEQLNEALETYNTKLKEAGKPLIYYGVSNKKTAILAPYFAPKGKAESMKSYYTDLIEEKEAEKEALQQTLKNLTHFFDKEIKASMTILVQNTIAKASGNGAVALSKYYFALKRDSNISGQSGVIKWYSVSKYDYKGSYFETKPINKDELNNQIKMLSSTVGDKNLKRINGWYNYLMGESLPDSKLLKEMLVDLLSKSSCTSIESAEAVRQKETFIKAIDTEDAQQIIKATENLCSDVLRTIEKEDYTYISKAIHTIAKGDIKEEGQAVILYYLHTIPNTHYEALFEDLKANDNTLLLTLLKGMKDTSINPFDFHNKKHYTSFIGALLYIGHQNDGQYLKKERAYLIETVFTAQTELAWGNIPIGATIAKIMSFNISSDEDSFETYLVENEYKKLHEILRYLTWEGIYNEEDIKTLGTNLGKFFGDRDQPQVFVDLLEIAFGSKEKLNKKDDNDRRFAQVILSMFGDVPRDARVYNYLVGENTLDMQIIKNMITSGYAYDSYADAFYKGLDNVIDIREDQNVYIALVGWALSSDTILDRNHERLITNIFNGIEGKSKEKQQIIYDFLTYYQGDTTKTKTYDYLKRCIEMLNSNKMDGQFITNYTKILKDNSIGAIEDRMYVLNYALDRGEHILYSDSEGLISHLFDNLSKTDAGEMSRQLKANNNQLFGRIWNVFDRAGVLEMFNTDNEYATNFVKQLSDIIKEITPVPDVSHLQTYLMHDENTNPEGPNYLNTTKIEKLPTIDMEKYRFIPMLQTDLMGNSTGNDYNYNFFKYESNIEFTLESAYVSVNLRIEDGYGQNGKTIIKAEKLSPMSWVTVQFMDETKLSDTVTYSKGTIIMVPAMYLAWMDMIMDGAKNDKLAEMIIETAAIIVGGAVITATGGALAPLLAEGVEIVFASVNLAIAMDEEGMKKAYGKGFIEGVQTTIMIYELALLPEALPGLFTLAKTGGKIIIKSGSAGFKAAIKKIKTFKGKGDKITIDGDLLISSLRKLKSEKPDQFEDRYYQAKQLLAGQKMAIEELPKVATDARLSAEKNIAQTQALVDAFKRGDDAIIPFDVKKLSPQLKQYYIELDDNMKSLFEYDYTTDRDIKKMLDNDPYNFAIWKNIRKDNSTKIFAPCSVK